MGKPKPVPRIVDIQKEYGTLEKEERGIAGLSAVEIWLKKHGKAVNLELTHAERAELQNTFEIIDADSSGTVGVDELVEAFTYMEINMSVKEVTDLLNAVDTDGSGEIEMSEFVNLMTHAVQEPEQNSKQIQSAEAAAKTEEAATNFPLMAIAYRRKKMMEALASENKAFRNKFYKNVELARSRKAEAIENDKRVSRSQLERELNDAVAKAVQTSKAVAIKVGPFAKRKDGDEYEYTSPGFLDGVVSRPQPSTMSGTEMASPFTSPAKRVTSDPSKMVFRPMQAISGGDATAYELKEESSTVSIHSQISKLHAYPQTEETVSFSPTKLTTQDSLPNIAIPSSLTVPYPSPARTSGGILANRLSNQRPNQRYTVSISSPDVLPRIGAMSNHTWKRGTPRVGQVSRSSPTTSALVGEVQPLHAAVEAQQNDVRQLQKAVKSYPALNSSLADWQRARAPNAARTYGYKATGSPRLKSMPAHATNPARLRSLSFTHSVSVPNLQRDLWKPEQRRPRAQVEAFCMPLSRDETKMHWIGVTPTYYQPRHSM